MLDAEVSNSTYAESSRRPIPDRFFEMFIAEQQLVAAAVGMQRAPDTSFRLDVRRLLHPRLRLIRMAAISRANIRLCGSHAGVCIGEDGPSQMALEDLAMMRAVHGSTVLYPERCRTRPLSWSALMADQQGISYLRTTREKTPFIYPPSEQFRGRQQGRRPSIGDGRRRRLSPPASRCTRR